MAEEDLIALRKEKLERLRARGIDPYPHRFSPSHSAAEAAAATPEDGAGPEATVAGRVTAMRDMGKAAFIDLRDGSGRIQAYFKQGKVGEDTFSLLKEVDLGDFVGVSGTLFRTRTKEPTVEAHSLTVLAKALRPPPEKYHGLQDVESRYRHRYLDLMANDEARRIFELRSKAVSAVRRYLDEQGYLEVETPILQGTAGGAAARPFETHHNALDRDFYLRVSLELHLKRLVIGGFDRVYEMGRIFRNEGVSTKYNPEFTMIELYEAYADYNRMMELLEGLVATIASDVLGSTEVQAGDETIDLSPPWPRLSLREAIRERCGVDFMAHHDVETLRKATADTGVHVEPEWGRGKLIDELLTAHVEPHLQQPTFMVDFPVELSPLAKRKTDEAGLVERFEAFICGREVANAYTELNDPIDQRQRFEEQARLRAAGDEETEIADEDFLVALEHGMPPTGGMGIGIDRLLMAIAGVSSIREVILFPALRERAE
ncbi:MAG TPA: lysine--tRNA ligase [Dehalococcoidia bacterium]